MPSPAAAGHALRVARHRIGGERRQFEVLVDPGRLANYGVALSAVEEALRRASRNTSAGFRLAGGQEYLIQGAGRVRDIDGIGATVITTRDTRPIRIRDVAELRVGESLKRGDGSRNGRPAVILGLHRQPDVNTMALTEDLEAVLEAPKAELPADCARAAALSQGDFIDWRLANLNAARATPPALIPPTLCSCEPRSRCHHARRHFLLCWPRSSGLRCGLSVFNSMTLGEGHAVGSPRRRRHRTSERGARLRENFNRPPAERRPVLDVICLASREIRASIVVATLIVMLAFLPLFFLSGVEGRLLQPLGIAYLVALFASLVVALTVTPALCAYLLPGARRIRDGREAPLAAWLKRGYGRLLPVLLRRPWWVVATAALLLVAALGAVPRMGRSFLPAFNEGSLVISSVTLPGTSLAESSAIGAVIEQLLLDVPEVAATARRTGRAERDEHVQGVESSEIDVRLIPEGRPREVVLAEIRERLSLVPGTNITIGQPISHRIDHMLSGSRTDPRVKIFATTCDARSRTGNVRRFGTPALSSWPGAQTTSRRLPGRFDRGRWRGHGCRRARPDLLETALSARRVGQILRSMVCPLVSRAIAHRASGMSHARCGDAPETFDAGRACRSAQPGQPLAETAARTSSAARTPSAASSSAPTWRDATSAASPPTFGSAWRPPWRCPTGTASSTAGSSTPPRPPHASCSAWASGRSPASSSCCSPRSGPHAPRPS